MQRIIDAVLRVLPIWVFILFCYVIGGAVAGLVGYLVNILMGGTPSSALLFTAAGGVVGLVLGIWAIIER
jgi:hypothetical protein